MSGFRFAFSLQKSEVEKAHPPGTAKLYDHQLQRSALGTHTDQDDILVLIPKPSADPADPLNWATWRKVMVLLSLCYYTFVGNVVATTLTSALGYLEIAFPTIPYAKLIRALAVNTLMMGCSNIFWVPLGNIFGRRTVTILGLLILGLTSIWCAKANDYGSLVGARIFQGIGIGPSETVSPTVIGEIFFLHQRGRAMAVYTVFLVLGSIIGAIIGSYIAAEAGWRWTQWLNVIMSLAGLAFTFFFQPETLYLPRVNGANDEDLPDPTSLDPVDSTEEKPTTHRGEDIVETASYAPFTFKRSLKVGMYRGNIIHEFIGPWRTLMFPSVWIIMLQYGGLVGGVAAAESMAVIFVSEPPYLWGAKAGLISIGGLIGSVLGVIATFFTSDFVVKRQAHRQTNGLSEPETRLPAMIPGLILATAGIWAFGFSAATGSPHAWIGLEFGIGMICFGLMQVPSIGFNYLIESYHSISGDCFVIITSLRAIISFAWSFFVGNWVTADGFNEPFGIFGMLMGIFGLLTIPLFVYGKRIRIATAHLVPTSGKVE
ncbi:uncharacterized protein N7483_003391 [Penicillium malachiteum]|uniref:uncharacterized protein n=1 Tax=Penicillium malachiteum TaxID=1324776 RepID=UPI002546A8A9|nr:uncharacterized protein N7483_003391 [Penicillium malachiteum]KAJ5728883.1 hypothetical protein N7483_003391 [Penicillium malachiteum]